MVTLSIFEPLYVGMLLLYQRLNLALQSPQTTIRKGLFTILVSRFGSKLFLNDPKSSWHWLSEWYNLWHSQKDFYISILAPPKRKYYFLYTDMFYDKLCFFLLNQSKVYFQVRKHTLGDSNVIGTHNHLVHKRTLNRLPKLASLAKWLSVHLQTKWLRVRITLLSLKLQIWDLLQARGSLTFRQTLECGFTLKLVCDMMIT